MIYCNDFLRHHTQDLCTFKHGPLFLAHPVLIEICCHYTEILHSVNCQLIIPATVYHTRVSHSDCQTEIQAKLALKHLFLLKYGIKAINMAGVKHDEPIKLLNTVQEAVFGNC